METISELRKICQTTAKKDRSNVYMRYVCRSVSIYLTRMLLSTKISANQVSFAMIVTGILSTCFFLFSSTVLFLIGAILMQMWYLLDNMDGEVARYRQYQVTKTIITDKSDSALSGAYYDSINHYIMNLLVPSTIGFGLFKKINVELYLLIGIAASLGQVLLLAMHDARHRVILTYLRKYDRVEMIKSGTVQGEPKKKRRSIWHLVFMVCHYTMTYPTVMNLVLVAAILDLAWPVVNWRSLLLTYLALSSALVASTIVGRNIVRRIIDKEVQTQYRVFD